MSAQDVIAEALDGIPNTDMRPTTLINLDRALVALDALKSAGYAVVELPEPDSTSYWDDDDAPSLDRLAWLRETGLYGVSVWDQGEVQVAYANEPGEPLSINETRRFAAALLAAANAAETDAK